MVKEPPIGAEDFPIPKLSSYIWMKRYNNNLHLTSINLCVQSEIYERGRGRGRRGERERERSLWERERREIERSFLEALGRLVGKERESSRKGDLSPSIPKCNKGGHISPCEWVMTY
jgi:hypothetical protein